MENNKKSIPDVPMIKLKSGLRSHYQYETIKNAVEVELAKIPGLKDEFKMDTQLTLMICNILEHMIVNNKKSKIDKKALVVKILSDLFELSDEEKVQIEGQIDFLHDNKQIKTVSLLHNVTAKLSNFFC